LHVVRKTRRAADPRDEHGALGREVLVAAQPLHRSENSVVAAAAAPARNPALIILEVVLRLVQLDQALGDGHRHDGSPAGAGSASFARSTPTSVPGLIGWPRDCVQQSTSTRQRERSIIASAA